MLTVLFVGNIARSRCGLKIGWGEFYESLYGCIDQVSGPLFILLFSTTIRK